MFGRKVIWAVDPFAKDKSLQLRTLKAIEAFAQGIEAKIEPVCVVSPDQIGIPLGVFDNCAGFHQVEAETILLQWLNGMPSESLEPLKVLTHKDFSTRGCVRTLLDYAHEAKADLVALSSHTKRAWQRLFVGSFAESLMLHSDIPLYVYTPRSKVSGRFEKILFPTDFTPASDHAFDQLLPLARAKGACILLYYKLEYLLPQTVDAINFNPTYVSYIREDELAKTALARNWVARAADAGVNAEAIVDDKPGFITESILNLARKRDVDMIAMASSSGGMSAVLLGSIARQVLRKAACPVWVLHPTEPKARRPWFPEHDFELGKVG